MFTQSITLYMIALILLISAFLLIYSVRVIKKARRQNGAQIRKTNGVFLFCLTGIILCGIVILGEQNPNNKEKLCVGEYTIEVTKEVETISAQAISTSKKPSIYSDNKFKFMLLAPSTSEFNEATTTSFLETFLKEMLFETRDNNLNAFLRFRSNKALLNCIFKSYELNTTKDIASCAIPFQKSGIFNQLLQFSHSIQFNNKVNTKIEITENSSLPFESLMQFNDSTQQNTDTNKIGFPNVKEFQFQSYLNIIVFEKKNSKGESQKINATNFLLMGANSMFQNIEKIVSNEDNILLCGNLTFKNVLVDGKTSNLVINRWFRLIDTDTKLYVLEMAHSPQHDTNNKSWLALKKSFESFKLIAN